MKESEGQFKPGELLVRFSKGVSTADVKKLINEQGLSISSEMLLSNTYRVKVPEGQETAIAAQLGKQQNVLYAEPDYLILGKAEGKFISLKPDNLTGLSGLPNDPLFTRYQWNLQNTGQTGGQSGADIRASEAWDVTTGNDFILAVISTGVDLGHRDLGSKIVDPGYNFITHAPGANDDNGRGTFLAGIAAAATGNAMGIAGISWGARILPLKALDSAGSGYWGDVSDAIVYAVDYGARIILVGDAGSTLSQTLRDAVQYAHEHQIVIVAPAHYPYPASLPGVIGTVASDANDAHPGWTGSGGYVMLSAPGQDVVSTYWQGAGAEYARLSASTPASAAHVAGVAALVLSLHPKYTADDVTQALNTSADDLGTPGWDAFFGYGRVNAARAVGLASGGGPPPGNASPSATATSKAPTATAIPGTSAIVLAPYPGTIGWVQSTEATWNHFNDDNMYTGSYGGVNYHGALQFDLSGIPSNTPIYGASVSLVGQSRRYVSQEASWSLKLLDSPVDANWSGLGYSGIHNANALSTISPVLANGDLAAGNINVFTLSASQLAILQDRLRTTRKISFRLDGPVAGDNLFSWETGYGTSGGAATGMPTLRLYTSANGDPATATSTSVVGTATPTATPTTGSPAPTGPTPTPCSGTTLLGCLGNNGIIRGYVFNDLDGDGQRDLIEPLVSGATIALRNSLGQILAVKITGQDGAYEFGGLGQGDYQLSMEPPPGYGQATTASLVSISASDFVFCCTVVVRFGVRQGPTPTTVVTVVGLSPTPTRSPTPTPIPTVVLPNTFFRSTRVQLPIIELTGGWDTWIQVQNTGNVPGKAILFLWGNPGPCPPQAIGPIKVECTGLLRPGSAWTFVGAMLPTAAKSGIVYSVPADIADAACEAAFATNFDHYGWLRWEQTYGGRGPNIGVVVHRKGPDVPGGTGGQITGAYEGISESMEGIYDPLQGGYMYYAPLNVNNYQGQTSTIIVNNSGTECISLEIYYKAQDNCLRYVIDTIYALAPGESRRITPPLLNPGTQGSAWIRASQPLGIVVDITGNGQLLTYRGVPADSWGAGYSAGSPSNYAPLIYREFNGWTSTIQVQNLSSTVNAKAKVYFVDNSGGIITTLVDWVCPRGSQTFQLANINNLPGKYVGAARIESQDWWSPGDPPVDAPNLLSIINLTNSSTGQGVSYNAFPQQQAVGVGTVALPYLIKGTPSQGGPSGLTQNSYLAIQDLNLNPGVTTFRIDFYDQNGLIQTICQTVNEKQVDYIDLANIGTLPPGFVGSAVVQVQHTTQPGGGYIAAVVVNQYSGTGDQSEAYNGIPIDNQSYNPPGVPTCN
ncbi:MAG: S8 family serine peptidase [Chloroflexi bacterium]|nr:S8 family serine peptidase [Chloroflexota bacterium]